ncbi:hypothetical protein MUN78_16605 [Leucobacter allii]|uniref:Uncharacterized protein n=1 Tax=Leucobacter allii TaxID=2932247 RepID=A0ABY4FLU0_9MICO|nr:hypothetical protein [Leucobacter allii]UOQ57252.1 hypothetical protein MUN78_16605 [Leucobacter allii]
MQDETVQAGNDAWEAWEQASSVAVDVEAALTAANEAAENALKAVATADGKNSIYVGMTEPAEDPEQPFTQGDLWYVTDISGRMTMVRIWNGDSWAGYQFVADSILVPGSVGPTLIEDGSIVTQKLSATAIDGMVIRGNEIIGATVSGSFFELLGQGATSAYSLVDAMESASSNWIGINASKVQNTAQFHSGTQATRFTPGVSAGEKYFYRSLGLGLAPMSLAGSVWAWAPSATTISTRFGGGNAFSASQTHILPAGVWTELTLTADAVEVGWSRLYFQFDSASTVPVTIDDLSIASAEKNNQLLSLSRDGYGIPQILGASESGPRFKLAVARGGPLDGRARGGQLSLWDESGNELLISGSSANFYEAGTGAIRMWMRNNLLALYPSTGSAQFTSNAPGGVFFTDSSSAGGGATLRSIQNDVRISVPAGKKIYLDGVTEFQGDTAWANIAITGGSGTCKWRRYLGMIELEFDITMSSALAAGAAITTLFSVPAAAAPATPAPFNVTTAGAQPINGFVSASTLGTTFRNNGTSSQNRIFGWGRWSPA